MGNLKILALALEEAPFHVQLLAAKHVGMLLPQTAIFSDPNGTKCLRYWHSFMKSRDYVRCTFKSEERERERVLQFYIQHMKTHMQCKHFRYIKLGQLTACKIIAHLLSLICFSKSKSTPFAYGFFFLPLLEKETPPIFKEEAKTNSH